MKKKEQNITDIIESRQVEKKGHKPVFFQLSKHKDKEAFISLLEQNKTLQVIDTYDNQLSELFQIRNPHIKGETREYEEEERNFKEQHYDGCQAWERGTWVHLSWRNSILHIVEEDEYQLLRTSRNRNLINEEEQKKYYDSTIGIAGLSVGNGCALAIVLMGGGKHMRLADPDVLELTNLNRIRSSIAELTEPKVHMTARQIYELNPYVDLSLYPDGLHDKNFQEFMDGLNVVVDEMDNIGMKMRLRQEARKRKIPVLMATDNGDSGLLDIERYDIDDSVVPFHGRGPKQAPGGGPPPRLSKRLMGMMIAKEFVGLNITETRVFDSLLEIGKSIPTWPQLGGAAILNGVAMAVAIRKIVTGQPVSSDRSVLSLSSMLIPNYDDADQVRVRAKTAESFGRQYNDEMREFITSTQQEDS